jgi:hypothetical protein
MQVVVAGTPAARHDARRAPGERRAVALSAGGVRRGPAMAARAAARNWSSSQL